MGVRTLLWQLFPFGPQFPMCLLQELKVLTPVHTGAAVEVCERAERRLQPKGAHSSL